jgi:hypothetical protein
MVVRMSLRQISILLSMSLAIGAFFASHANAQIAGATLSGTVTDQSGAVVPQATITIKNVATGVTRSNTTSAAGYYSAPNLLPGIYEIKAEAQGFTSKIQTGVNLTVGEQQVLNFSLQVGQMSTVVEVSTEAPNVDLASSTISAVVSSTTVRELPLNGRSWTDLATLQPGVNSIQTQPDFTAGPDRGKRGFGNQLTIDGARPQQNNYRLDGISTNDYDNAAPGSVLGGDLGVDAIQEFSVLTSNYSADYGRTAGGVVNAITRSGTNQIHGSVYEFLRNDALDAANFFENAGGIPKASFRQNQFGVAAGGPIRKDKLFVFGDYEALRYSKGIPTLIDVPSDAARLGILAGGTALDPTAACTGPAESNGAPAHNLTATLPTTDPNYGKATVCVDDNAAKYLPFWPRATSTPAGSDTGSFTFSARRVVSENFETVRVDDRLSDKDSLAATYLGDITPYSAPDQLEAVLLNSRTNRQIGILEETHIFNSSVTNSARFGFSRDAARNNVGLTAINPLAKDPSLAATPGQFAAQAVVSGVNSFTGGIGANGPGLFRWNSFQGYDDAFWTHGSHSIKFGAAVERMQLNMDQLSESSGTFTFNSLGEFLTNQPHKFTLAQSANATEGLRQTLFGLYIQDDWRARPNLTLNLGLRWEMTTVPTEVQGKLATLFNLYTDALPHCATVVTGSCAGGGPLLPNATLHNFDPRVGFAWDPFHNGKTAVRGGFGIFDVLPLISVSYPATTVAPFQTTGFLQHSGNLPGSFFTKATGLLNGTSQEASYYDRQPHRSYNMQWNLNVQRELAPNLTVLVGYVGSRALHLGLANNDRDIVLPTLTSAGYLFPQVDGNGNLATPQCTADPTQCNPPLRINESFGDISGITYNGQSYYNALEVGVQKTMSHGLAVHSSFTWGKSIDTGSAGGAGDQFSNSIGAPPWYDLRSIRGLSDFNIGRTLVVTVTWQVPSPKSWSGAAGWITSGWELGGIYKVSDGVPFTPTFGTDGDPQGLLSSDTWDFPNRLTTPGCQSLVNPGNPNHYIKTQCFAIPTAPSPAFFNMPAPLGCNQATGQSTDPTMPFYLWCFNLRGTGGRNILIGPGTSNLDFSVFKNIPIKKISESFNVQFRSEFFNILNHPNFAVPVTPDHTDIFDSNGNSLGAAGKLTSTSTTGREIQFALKLVW